MKRLFFWLLPPAGFVSGWILGLDDRSSLSERAPAGFSPSEVTVSDANVSSASAPRFSEPDETIQPNKTVPVVPLKEILGYASEFHRLGAFIALLDTLSPEQFPGLHAELISPENPDDRILDLFFRRWAMVSPQLAVETAIADGKAGKGGWIHTALNAWGEKDAMSALAYARNLGFETLGKPTVESLKNLAYPKPGSLPVKEALRRIREVDGSEEPSTSAGNAVGRIFHEWAKTDPEAAFREALTLPADGANQPVRNWALSRVIDAQNAVDPEAAARLIETLPEGPERTRLQSHYMITLVWGKQDRLAKAYALALPEGPARRQVISTYVGVLLDSNKEEAAAFISNLPASDWQDPSIFSHFFEKWMRTEPQRASEVLLAHIPADLEVTAQQQAAYERMFSYLEGNDPLAAAELLLKLPKSVRGTRLENAVAIFTDRASEKAAQWAASLPPGPDRDAVMQQVAVNMTVQGVTGITNWLNQLPPDSGKFAAIEGFARQIVSVSPDDALAWLRSEPNESMRLERLKRVWNSWVDRDAAQRWRDTSPELSAAERAVLR